jgi:hypothetical protein
MASGEQHWSLAFLPSQPTPPLSFTFAAYATIIIAASLVANICSFVLAHHRTAAHPAAKFVGGQTYLEITVLVIKLKESSGRGSRGRE